MIPADAQKLKEVMKNDIKILLENFYDDADLIRILLDVALQVNLELDLWFNSEFDLIKFCASSPRQCHLGLNFYPVKNGARQNDPKPAELRPAAVGLKRDWGGVNQKLDPLATGNTAGRK